MVGRQLIVRKRIPNITVLALFALGAFVLSGANCPPPVTPQPVNFNLDYRLVFPTTAAAPTIDGQYQISNVVDSGWTSSSLFDLDSGTNVDEALVRATSDAGSAYLYFEIEDVEFNAFDALVVGLNPSGSSTGYHRLHIYPCPLGSAGCSGTAANVDPQKEYWTGQYAGAAWTWTSAPVPAGVDVKIAHAEAGASKRWAVELKLPRGAPFSFPNNQFFGFFVDLIKITDESLPLANAAEFSWPPGVEINGTLEDHTPEPNRWGNAVLGSPNGNGVYISSSDLKTNHGPATISLNHPNEFSVTAHNNLQNSGTFVVAKNVRATFKIANNGLPALGNFAPIPVTNNPTTYTDIPPTGSRQYKTDQWNLTAQQVTDYTAHPSQCVRVELDSSDSGTLFWTKTAMSNMTFVTTSSPFHRVAQVGTKGYEPVRGDKKLEFLLEEYLYNVDPKLEWSSDIKGVERIGKNRYRLLADPGKDFDLDITINPPKMEASREVVRLPPGSGGAARPAIRLAVEAGSLLTIYAEGSVLLGGQARAAGPNGFDLASRRDTAVASDQNPAGLLLSESFSPQSAIGAIIGSWDGFKSSFPVGQAVTFRAPQDARELQLAINDFGDGYAKQSGEGFTVQVIRSSLRDYHLFANSILANDPRAKFTPLPLGANLPSWIMRGKLKTGNEIVIKNRRFAIHRPIGSFAYLVRDMK